MKQLFFLFGLSAISLSSFAQQGDQHQHYANNYGVSVFSNSHTLRPSKRADIGLNTKLQGQFPGWYITTDPWTGGFKDLNGKPFAVSGTTLLDKATNLMKNQLSIAGIKPEEWKLDHQFTNNKGFSYLYFYQEVDGKKVAFTKMHFRFTPDGKIARINMKGYGKPDVMLSASISETKALESAMQELDGATVTNKFIEADLEWFPIPSAEGYLLHPAYKFRIEGKTQEAGNIPLNIFGYVDAVNGDLLYRDNETKDAIDLKVVGSVYTDGFINPAKVVGLPYVSARIGSSTTLLANDTGYFSSATIAAPTDAVITLEGPWSTIRSFPDAGAVSAFLTNISVLGKSDSFNGAFSYASTSRHVNAYYHVNTVHDFMKKMYGSSFTGMDYSLITVIDTIGECNAFFTSMRGSSINFFPPSTTCPSYSELRDVVYHEYGHAIVSKMYTGGMRNGALNEGQADVWSMGITRDSVLARGSRWTPGSFIRRYDLAPKVYPMDLVGQVHADGEIIAGIWWDYGKNVGSIDSMSSLFAQCLLNDKPDGANGTEGEVYFEMLMSALINDDNDAILSNGTPHFNEIVSAFARHGIYLLQDIDITHNELAHQDAGKPINVNASLTIANPTFFQSLNLVYKVRGGTWTTVTMVDAGGFNFSAQIPAQTEGTVVDYYFSAKDPLSNEGKFFPDNYYPTTILAANKVTLPYQFAVGVSRMRTVDFEGTLDPDWQIGVAAVDKATSGKWVVAKPIGTTNNSLVVQTGSDHTTGSGKCLVTGNAVGTAYTESIKNGLTSVRTPFYDLTTYTNPIVEYYRWFSNDRGRNPKKEIWRVQISTGSDIFLKEVENTNQSDHQWRRRVFNVYDYYPAAAKMQLRFLATETIPSGSTQNGLVEAGVDDFVIYEGKEGLISSIGEKEKALAQIYPNPAVDELNVILPSATFKTLSISFYDVTGKLISTVPITNGATAYSIDTKSMTPGQYLLVVQMDQTIQTHKVTIATR